MDQVTDGFFEYDVVSDSQDGWLTVRVSGHTLRVLKSSVTAMSMPERIRRWVKGQFAARYVDRVTADLVDVAAGNREGNGFENEALVKIFG
jgi:hypothetical protein